MNETVSVHDAVIIGAGPAGLTAALYCGRNRLKTLVISEDLGGQTAVSGPLDNYPGAGSTTGLKLINIIKNQVALLPTIELQLGQTITQIKSNSVGYTLSDQTNHSFQTRAIIIAAGKRPKKLGIPGEDQFAGHGVSYCATCDGPLFQDKTVAIIGGGYSASEAALILNQYTKHIYVLTHKPQLQGEAVTLEKIKESPKITLIGNTQTVEITGEQTVTDLKYRDQLNGQTKSLAIEGIFVEIGSLPNTDYFKDQLSLNQWNEIIIDDKNRTNLTGVFAAGDVTSVFAKQTIVAAGEGAKAAMAVFEYLSNRK